MASGEGQKESSHGLVLSHSYAARFKWLAPVCGTSTKAPLPQPNSNNLTFANRFKFLARETSSLSHNEPTLQVQENVETSNPKESSCSNGKKEPLTKHLKKDVTRAKKEDDSLLERCEFHERGKMIVKKVMALLAKDTPCPYGPHLLLNTQNVIKVIESLPYQGITMLFYFTYTVRFLKEMVKAKIAGAKRAMNTLQLYKITNYEHYKRRPTEGRVLRVARADFVNAHKEQFEKNLAKVKEIMARMKKPIYIAPRTSLASNWTRILGFLTLWIEEEIGFSFCHKTFNREILFKATPVPGGHLYEFSYKGPKGNVKKTMSARLVTCLYQYSTMRSWRVPKQGVFLMGVHGSAFKPNDMKRYVPSIEIEI